MTKQNKYIICRTNFQILMDTHLVAVLINKINFGVLASTECMAKTLISQMPFESVDYYADAYTLTYVITFLCMCFVCSLYAIYT